MLAPRTTLRGDGDLRLTDFPRFAQRCSAGRLLIWWARPLVPAARLPCPSPCRPMPRPASHLCRLRSDGHRDSRRSRSFSSKWSMPVRRSIRCRREPGDHRADRWSASPHARFERLLRGTQVAQAFCNGDELRLVYAPQNETRAATRLSDCRTPGRSPVVRCFLRCTCCRASTASFRSRDGSRLLDVLAESRKVPERGIHRLSGQVLARAVGAAAGPVNRR